MESNWKSITQENVGNSEAPENKPFPKTSNSKSESNWKLNAKQQHF